MTASDLKKLLRPHAYAKFTQCSINLFFHYGDSVYHYRIAMSSTGVAYVGRLFKDFPLSRSRECANFSEREFRSGRFFARFFKTGFSRVRRISWIIRAGNRRRRCRVRRQIAARAIRRETAKKSRSRERERRRRAASRKAGKSLSRVWESCAQFSRSRTTAHVRTRERYRIVISCSRPLEAKRVRIMSRALRNGHI